MFETLVISSLSVLVMRNYNMRYLEIVVMRTEDCSDKRH